jgi:hypothetical protein
MLLLIQIFLRALTQEQKEQINSEPLLCDCFEVLKSNPTQRSFALFFWHAMYYGSPLEGVALLKDPSFLYKVEQAMGEDEVATWNGCNRGSIWDFAGIRQHAMVNGTLRPVITWKK